MNKIVWVFIVLISGFSFFAQSEEKTPRLRGQQVASFELLVPEDFVNKYATVFFVSASKGVLPTGSSIPIVHYVLKRIPAQMITENQIIKIESVIVPKVNTRKFNYMYILIHEREDDIYIKNPDKNCPPELGLDEDPCLFLSEDDERFKYLQGYTKEWNPSELPGKRSVNDISSWQRLK